jgi:hypothetical protein
MLWPGWPLLNIAEETLSTQLELDHRTHLDASSRTRVRPAGDAGETWRAVELERVFVQSWQLHPMVFLVSFLKSSFSPARIG